MRQQGQVPLPAPDVPAGRLTASARPTMVSATEPSPTRTLSEHESKARVRAAGVVTAPEALVPDGEGAVQAAHEIGFPVVLKLCGDAIAHKTERGLVRLGLTDDVAVRAAAAELLAAARPEDGVVNLLVARMVRGNRELIAGCLEDPTFGRCVMLGIGGIFAEALADVAFRLVPLSERDAYELIDDLRTQKLLGAFRGEPAIDRAAVAATLLALSRLFETSPEIVSIDLNPLLITDGKPIAVDALIEVREP